MACEIYFDDVRGFREASSKLLEKARGVRRQLGGGGARCSLRFDFGSATASPALQLAPLHAPLTQVPSATTTSHSPPSLASPAYHMDIPFNKEMDEITYWIYTRRAPCLMKHDMAKCRREEAASSQPRIIGSIHSISDSTCSPAPKIKKKKLSILDDDSVSAKEPKNIYFDNQQKTQHKMISSTKSDSIADPDFNIKRSSIQDKLKRKKQQNQNRSKNHKRSKIVSSTPIANVRRSLRNSRKGFTDVSHLNSSFEILNDSLQNGNKKNSLLDNSKLEHARSTNKCRRLIDKLDIDLKQAKAALQRLPGSLEKPKRAVNGEFENLSDVSGFTANYIRSTKSAIKNGKKSKSKHCQALMKQCTDVPDQGQLLGCSAPGRAKCHSSSETEQIPNRVHRRTSLLKLMSSKSPKKGSSKDHVDGNVTSDNLDSSLNSPNKMCLRYPRRRNASAKDDFAMFKLDGSLGCSRSPRTRRKAAVKEDRVPARRSLRRGTGRDRSGFAACFSDSDDEKPLRKQKFFG